jgi:GT2 family glycosyltransferase
VALSAVICTKDRPDFLKACLESILSQTTLPKEVIIVNDHGNRGPLSALVSGLEPSFRRRGVAVSLVDSTNPPGLTQARNFGALLCSGELVSYLDDDVVLDSRYVEELEKGFSLDAGVQGAQGYLGDAEVSPFFLSFRRVFKMMSPDPTRCEVMPSGHNPYPLVASSATDCQWLSGTNMTYRRSVLARQRFDTNLKAPPSGEDLDFSFRLECASRNSLRMFPSAKIKHMRQSKANPSKPAWFMREAVYRAYLTFKFRRLAPERISLFWFAWSRAGFLLEQVIGFASGRGAFSRRQRAMVISNYLRANFFALENLGKIVSGHVEFLNSKY